MKYNYETRVYNISFGNRKLVSNNKTLFLIWNLPAEITCPYATKMCKEFCYAKKAEKLYKAVLPSRSANLESSKSGYFYSDMTDIITRKLSKMRQEKMVIRIHESGDFYNKSYALKWLAIADHFADDPRVTFICYTKSFTYFDDVELPKNFSLRASIWADTTPEQVKLVLKNGWPIYTAVDSFTDNDTFEQCRCSDCATCGKCWDKSVPDIRCEIH